MSEATEQKALFKWAEYMTKIYPELKLMHHVPNGGKRDSREAHALKQEGVKAGVPDVFLPVGRGGYFGLYIEMKYGKNKTSKMQDMWIEALREQNYRVEVCYGFYSAREVIEEYMIHDRTIANSVNSVERGR